LTSHGIDEVAVSALLRRDPKMFAESRGNTMREALRRLGERLAGWNREDNDRPSIMYLRRQAESP